MGKGGRIACIFVPMALSMIALALLAIVGLAQTNQNNHYLSSIYLLKADMAGAAQHPELLSNAPNNETDSHDISNNQIVIYNNYTVGLWNYCAGGGQVSNDTSPDAQDPASHIAFCTGRETQFAFNPETVWGLPDTFTTRFFSSDLSRTLDDYEHGLAKAIGPLYILTVGAAAVSVLIGFGAIFSRIGSIITTIASLITTGLAFSFAGVTSAAFLSLKAVFNEALNKEGIYFNIGPQVFAMMWLAVAALLVGSLFWSFSSCCVSGHSSRRGGPRDAPAQQWGSGYKRMDQPPQAGWNHEHQQQEVPLTAYGGHHAPAGQAYEPYRHA